MDLEQLRKPDLLLMCEELGIDARKIQRKPLLVKAIQALGADDKELSECWEIIKERREAAKAKEEREAEERRREASELKAKEEREAAVEMKRLELEMKRLEMNQAVRGVSNPGEVKALKIKDLMQPFKVGEDIGLFLVNFERTCNRIGWSRDTWPQLLLTLLPCEAAQVVARLSPEEAADYDAVKLGLQKKYRLSTEAFRQRFRGARKKPEESYIEFAYNLRSNLVEWLKSAEVYGNHDGIVECFGLEQLYKGMPEVMRYWVQDKNPDTTQKAAELAEEFVARRSSQKEDTPERKFPGARGDYRGKYYKPRSEEDKREPKDSVKGAHRSRAAGGGEAGEENHRAEKQGPADETTKKQFEARKPMRCFRCNETGHMAAGCRKPRVVFSYLSKDDENDRLLEPYLHDLLVNGEPCKVLRDCAATLDVVHPSLVQADHYTGECAWIRQVVEQQSVCLPVARVTIQGPFGTLETEAAVSANLPPQYPYLFSNKSDQKLRKMGKRLTDGVVMALTRSKARELASQLRYNEQPETSENMVLTGDAGQASETRSEPDDEGEDSPGSDESSNCDVLEMAEGRVVPPVTSRLQSLLRVGTASLQSEQKTTNRGDRVGVSLLRCLWRRNRRTLQCNNDSAAKAYDLTGKSLHTEDKYLLCRLLGCWDWGK
ncbi:axoneme-associated protein mst101(2)-like [Ixodes scapularis]